ncbi:MAG: hypothetical protein COB02_13230 [Candidatus Cloacimonadota bacterium]|nr:MAG: hypothetical protein COB02_13230 [Candidatus Cloacimonadota bacterium]
MKLFIILFLSLSFCLFANTDYFGISLSDSNDFFGGISLDSKGDQEIILEVETEEETKKNNEIFLKTYYPRKTDTNTSSTNNSNIDKIIQEVKKLNQNKEYTKALNLLRALNFQMNFNDIKAQYYFAKQYLIIIEKKAFPSGKKNRFFKKAKHHISKVEKHIKNNNVKSSEKEYFKTKIAALKVLYRSLLPKSDTQVADAPSSNNQNELPDFSDPSSNSSVTPDPNDSASNTSSSNDSDSDGSNNNDLDGALSQDNLAANKTPIYNLQIESASEITEDKAKIIFNAMGFSGPDSVHKLSYSKSLAALCNGKTYGGYSKRYTGPNGSGCKGIGLNDKKRHKYHRTVSMKQYLFEEYKLLRAAVIKYKAYPIISYRATPELYDKWIRKAAEKLTAVPRAQRYALLQSQLKEESGRAHWRNFRPIASQAGAVGVAQLLPATAIIESKVNPYDPEGNFIGGAIYLNKMIKAQNNSIKNGLAAYNGGGGNVNASGPQGYARHIMARVA